MRNLTLADLNSGLQNLLTNEKRRKALHATRAGKFFEPMLTQKADAIAALPAEVTGGAPLAGDLRQVDDVHDGFGKAIWHLTEAYLSVPNASPEIIAAAARVRADFIPKLADVQAKFIDEAHAANEHAPSLKTRKADLALFPIADGSTLAAWATSFIGAGVKLGELLNERADAAGSGRTGAGKLRSQTIGLLGRFRDGLADEIQSGAKLPVNIDRLVFGYFDLLAAAREKSGPTAAPPPAPADPAAPPPATAGA